MEPQRWTPPDFSNKPLENQKLAIEKGYQEGFEKGLLEAKSKIAQKEAELSQLILKLSQSIGEWESSLTPAILRIVQKIVTVFLKSEQSPELLSVLIVEALSQLEKNSFPVTVLLNPEHYTLLSDHWKNHGISFDDVQLKPSDHIQIGGCQLECQQYFYDGSWDARLENILSHLLSQTKNMPSEDAAAKAS